jgi:hypothetical protein
LNKKIGGNYFFFSLTIKIFEIKFKRGLNDERVQEINTNKRVEEKKLRHMDGFTSELATTIYKTYGANLREKN